MASISLVMPRSRVARPLLRRALALFAEELTAAQRRAAVDALERRTARRVAEWFMYQGNVVVRVLGQAMAARMDAAAREGREAGRRLTEDSWADWDYLLNQIMYGRHPGGVGELREIITDGRTTAYATGAEEVFRALGLETLGMKIGVGSAEAVAHATREAAKQVTRINDTTRSQLRTLITQAVDNGWSWNRTAEAIIERYKDFAGKPLFPSKTFTSRAEMIAAYEIGDAYEAGGQAQARAAAADSLPMEKSWLHAGDDRVRNAHRANAAAGWLALDAPFPDGSERPPTDPGCRCAVAYRVRPGFFPERRPPGEGVPAAQGMFTPSALRPAIYGKGVAQSAYRTAESEAARLKAVALDGLYDEADRLYGEVADLKYMIASFEEEGRKLGPGVYADLERAEVAAEEALGRHTKAVNRLLSLPEKRWSPFTYRLSGFNRDEALSVAVTLEDVREFVSDKMLPAGTQVLVTQDAGLRAAATMNRIYLGATDAVTGDITPVFHEMGHVIEYANPRVQAAALAFRDRRTRGETPVRLSQALDASYDDREIALPDEFLDPYMGKLYPDYEMYDLPESTEIVAMGMEWMRLHPNVLARRDPDYFHFMYHLLRGNWDVLEGGRP